MGSFWDTEAGWRFAVEFARMWESRWQEGYDYCQEHLRLAVREHGGEQ